MDLRTDIVFNQLEIAKNEVCNQRKEEMYKDADMAGDYEGRQQVSFDYDTDEYLAMVGSSHKDEYTFGKDPDFPIYPKYYREEK